MIIATWFFAMPDIRISPCLQLGLLILFSILIHVLAKCAYKLATTVSNVIALRSQKFLF